MGQTTYRSLLFGSFLIPLLFIARELNGPQYGPKLLPDTQSYVLSSPYRTGFYPTFLNLSLSEETQREALQTKAAPSFGRVVAIQKAFLLIGALLLFVSLHRLLPFSHLFLFTLAILFFEKSLQDLFIQTAWIIPDGLSVGWIILATSLALHVFQKKELWGAFVLAAVLSLGTWLSPRLLCFIPLLVVLIPLRTLHRKRFLPFALLTGLLLIQCFYTYSKANTFSLSSLNGFYTIGSSLRFLSQESPAYFTDPKTRTFLERALEAPDRKTEIRHNDWMTWTFATRIYRDTFSEKFSGIVKSKDVLHMNRFYASIFPTLISKDSEARQAWIAATFRQLWVYFRFNLAANIILLGGGILSLFMFWHKREAILFIPVLFALIHMVNVFLTVPFCGLVDRYLGSTQWLQVLTLFTLGLYLWDFLAAWALDQLTTFKRRSEPLDA